MGDVAGFCFIEIPDFRNNILSPDPFYQKKSILL